jgi:glycosyltransferase involved in cell wall biosynthesis
VNALRAMARLRPDDEFLVYSNFYFDRLDATNIHQTVLAPPASFLQVPWDQLLFPHWAVPMKLNNDGHDVAHFTNNYISAWGGQPAVVTIHDMTPFVIPESYGSAHGHWLRNSFRLAARRARHLVTVSENSKQDICRILKVRPERVTVIPLAADLREDIDLSQVRRIKVQERFGIRHPFILYVGAIHPRKNVRRLIEAYARLRQDPRIPHQLVVAGAQRWMAKDIISASGISTISNSDIIFTGKVTEAELVALYEKTEAFVYPSIYEGFGLPVLEAMSLGAPVVTSQGSSLSEVAGNAAVLADPTDAGSIANAIAEVLNSPTHREQLIQRGFERASLFSWKRTAEALLDVFDTVAK